MEQKNLSVFGDVVRNEEIADFIRLVNLTRDIFHQEMTTLEIMPGGLTNKNFHSVLEGGTQVAIRLAGKVMRRYHDSGMEFKTSFDPISKIDEYKAIMAEHKYEKRYDGWDRIVENLDRIAAAYKKNPPRRVPCHNDTLAENFMLQDEKMRVIDWEYGGMNDGYYDIACVCVENPLDEACEETFLRAYCGGEPSDEARARVLINKFLVTSHWSTWSLVQICYGKDPDFYWEYGRTRAVQACSFLDDLNFARYLEIIGG